MKRYVCTLHIEYSCIVDAQNEEMAENSVFETMVDDIMQGVIATDIYDTYTIENAPELVRVDVVEVNRLREESDARRGA